MTPDLIRIVSKTGMSCRAGYYSGYGANDSDLGAHRLVAIHQGITETWGAKAAEGFVAMVKGLKSLGATPFLLALEKLQANEWVWETKAETPPHLHVDSKNPDGSEASPLGMGFQLLAGTFTDRARKDRDDRLATSSMRRDFCFQVNAPLSFEDQQNDYEMSARDFHERAFFERAYGWDPRRGR